MGNAPSNINIKREFTFTETDEPHASRRRLILAKHPEIKSLFVKEPLTAVVVAVIVIVQFLMAYYVRDASWWVLLLASYVVSATLNHTSQLAVHELSHNLAFESVFLNKLTAMFANLPTGLASASLFTQYHMEHHQCQGYDGIDADTPTQWEIDMFKTAPQKLLFLFLQFAFYSLRPLFVRPKKLDSWGIFCWIVQITVDLAVLYFWGWRSMFYLMGGCFLGIGLHPTAGHFIAEHYQFVKGYETYSYYGPLNPINLNVGYHNEHHDFPKIPWTKLPLVRKIAPEFYDNLPCYDSYLYVMYKFVTDPTLGPFSRIKRKKAYQAYKDE